ncbi:MAG: hypothetical protein V1660_03470 [archaeon]
MRNIILLLVIAIFCIPLSNAYLSSEIYLSQDGSATFIGRASNPVEIEGISFQNGQIIGVTEKLTSKEAEIWTFSVLFNDSAELKIFLPDNAELKSSITSNLDTMIGSEKGTIVINTAGYNPEISFQYILKKEGYKDYSYLITFGLLIAAILTFIIVKRKKKERENKKKAIKLVGEKKSRKIDIVKKTLNEREQIIINELLKLKKAKQRFLQKKTEIPKASFSRYIQNLEKKGIITKKGIGKNNLIELKKEML